VSSADSATVRPSESLIFESEMVPKTAVLEESSQVPILPPEFQTEFAASWRIPALYENRKYVDVGGLMSYGPNFPSLHRRAADYVERIFKGASPQEMPFEQPTEFELIINIPVARALGAKFPHALLLRADEIVQ
jgi:ABC transporter substrate binding protein